MGGLDYQIDDATEVGDQFRQLSCSLSFQEWCKGWRISVVQGWLPSFLFCIRLIPCFCEPIVYRTPLEPPVELAHLHGNHSPVLSFAIFSAPLGLGTWLYTN